MTTLNRLLAASHGVLSLVRVGSLLERTAATEFIAAMDVAQEEVNAQTEVNVRAVIDKSWDLGWAITESEALTALAVIPEFPDRKLIAIKAFRTRTDDGGITFDFTVLNRLKRAKEIIEAAQEVIEYGV